MNSYENIAELKLNLFRQLDALKPAVLVEFNRLLQIYLKNQNLDDEWRDTTEQEKEMILKALDEVENGEFFSHETVMQEFREKFYLERSVSQS